MRQRTQTRTKDEPVNPNWDSETNLLTWLATCVSVFSFLFYYRNGDSMLYGDAVAHINIARRVFDSRTPGLLQLGTVWLPLPHLLIIPFILSKRMWQSGAGGSIPSMVAYVFGAIGIFRLTRRTLSRTPQIEAPARFAAWTAAITYGANPNLIYMQSTAMGEALYLAFFIWAVMYFSEAVRGETNALTKSGFSLAGACLVRYDGWFLAAAMGGIVLLISLWPRNRQASQRSFRFSKAHALKFIVIAAAAPALWLAYNGIVYRNPLEFENGPYSAKAIERRTQTAGNPGHPGSGNPFLAGQYFIKSAEDNIAQNEWLQRTWILLALAACIGATAIRPRVPHSAALLLLLIPLPFYALSIAYGGVPIFIPQWWPFTHYNARYGLQLLPVFSVGLALLVYLLAQIDGWPSRVRLACVGIVLAVVAASYGSIWYATPICLEEARSNMRTRTEFQKQLATLLEKLPPDSTLLMYTGDHVGALERAGISLKRTINEGNHRVWKQPADREGLWEHALADPSRYADYVLAFEGDPVWQAVHDAHLRELVDIHVTGQARAVLYRAR